MIQTSAGDLSAISDLARGSYGNAHSDSSSWIMVRVRHGTRLDTICTGKIQLLPPCMRSV
jgi:hypothetical protein